MTPGPVRGYCIMLTTTKHQLDAVFLQRYDELLGWCQLRLAGRRDLDPRDLVHQAYIRCARRWSDHHRAAARPETYVYRALGWVLIDALRTRHPPCLTLASFCGKTSPMDSRWAILQQLIAREAVCTLTVRQRLVCEAVVQAPRTRDEIAAELCLTTTAVAVHLSRACVRLRDFFDRRDPA